MSTKITRESLLARQVPPKMITIPDYGKWYLRCLTRAEINIATKLGKEMDAKTKGDNGVGQCILAAAICDEDGQRVFTEGHEAEVDQLQFPVFTALNKELNKVHKLNVDPATVAADVKH